MSESAVHESAMSILLEKGMVISIATNKLVYKVGNPIPNPEGYDNEPLIVIAIRPQIQTTLEESIADVETATEGGETKSVEEPTYDAADDFVSEYLVFALPDEQEVKRGIIGAAGRFHPAPKDMATLELDLENSFREAQQSPDPNYVQDNEVADVWEKIVNYNHTAHRHSANGVCCVAVVNASEVVRVERMVERDVFEAILNLS